MKIITNCQGQGLKEASEIIATYKADTIEQIEESLQWITHQQNQGYFVSGYFSYEAMQAFEKKFPIKKSSFTLAKFYAFKKFIDLKPQKPQSTNFNWQREINQEQYLNDINKILNYIYEGDVYQINYSFRQTVTVENINWQALFIDLVNKQQVPYSYLIIDEELDNVILSLSPELFLKRQSNKLISQPMKGTIKRGRFLQEDDLFKKQLATDSKSQAENIMIVDLMRNDFSKICQPHSIKVKDQFQIKTFSTLHQMVTTVEGKLKKETSLFDIFSATYPAGSITGTPKKRAIEIINTLEKSPRHIYTGSMALFLPNGDFITNVAIRTLLYHQGKLELGLGSGIVANSDPSLEWQECLLKSNFLNNTVDYTFLFETLLYRDEFINLHLNLNRLEKSAHYFQQKFCRESIKQQLIDYQKQLSSPRRVRLMLYRDGSIKFEHMATTASWDNEPVKIKISDKQVNSQDIYLYHKTDRRPLYLNEFKIAKKQGYDEVIFCNEKGFITEGSTSNIFVQNSQGNWQTPAISNGLLAGTMRLQLLTKLNASETDITVAQLHKAHKIIICNSIRQQTLAILG